MQTSGNFPKRISAKSVELCIGYRERPFITLCKLRFIVDQYGCKLAVLANFWRKCVISNFNKICEMVYGIYGKFHLLINAMFLRDSSLAD
jgi:hypothetical protein